MEMAESTMITIMARESAYSGQAFDFDLLMGVPPLPAPGVYKFS
jgi:hypothetical protein